MLNYENFNKPSFTYYDILKILKTILRKHIHLERNFNIKYTVKKFSSMIPNSTKTFPPELFYNMPIKFRSS